MTKRTPRHRDSLVFSTNKLGPIYLHRDPDDPHLFYLEVGSTTKLGAHVISDFTCLTILTENDLDILFEGLTDHIAPGQRRRVDLRLTLLREPGEAEKTFKELFIEIIGDSW